MAERADVVGLVLAAGAGRRFGQPKALVELDGEPLLARAIRTLRDGGCARIRVVLGAQPERAATVLAEPELAVYAPQWRFGMGESLRVGLACVGALSPAPDAVLVHLVDLPWVGAPTVARLCARASGDVVARASYAGTPGHPVLFGRRWWTEIAAGLRGDQGAKNWLRARDDVCLVECGDLGSGADVDTPADLPS